MAITVIQGDLKEMIKEGPIYGTRMKLAHQYCTGSGIELGAAAHNPFDLPNSINVAPFSDDPSHVDYRDFLFYQQEQVKRCGHYAKVDLVGEAHAIPLDDNSQDYVISSHVVEHLPNLVTAFLEWNRILRPGGVIFMIFPKRDALPSDVHRPITPLSHYIDDYNQKQTIWTHANEAGHSIRGHYHVFTLNSMLELIQWADENLNLGWKVEAVEETDSKVGNGHTVVCRYLPGEDHAYSFEAVKVDQLQRLQAKLLPRRLTQLLNTSSRMIRQDGFLAFANRLFRWLRGERRYDRK
ncbi:MAG: class I SAM-dependent methyltransferase [Anaerolineae bacterium]|nr:class I SAM-dependent methyltransferase [Anaerolineae bacterium]